MIGPHSRDSLAGAMSVLRGRVAVTRAAESLLLGALAGLVLLAVSLVAGAQPNVALLAWALVAGIATAAIFIVARQRTWAIPAVAAEAERAVPALRNHLVTALELDANPERASPRIASHVRAYAARVLADASPAQVHPYRRALLCLCGAALAVVTGILSWSLWPEGAARAVRHGQASASAPDAMTPGIARVEASVAPPAYLERAVQATRDPARLDVIAGSRVNLRITNNAPDISIELGTARAPTHRSGANAVDASVTPAASALLMIAARSQDGRVVDRRLVPIVVHPDKPPDVAIEQPRTDLTLENATSRVGFAVRASDDYALASLSLHYTKVTGSGEQYAFKEGELPLSLVREGPGRWRGEATSQLSTLGLDVGDLLVYYARAADRRPGAEPSVSDSYVIEIGRPHAAVAGGFAVAPEKDQAALSMSALLVKTERLHAARPRLAAADVSARAASLAVEQRMVRSETLFLMGAHGEVEDEEAEAEQSHEIQEGRLENRGQADLRLATRLMSTAERYLLLADTGAALPAQRAALAAMQRALGRQRYFLRTLPVRSQIDLTRRLSGDLAGALAWRRSDTRRPDDERAADIRRLLADLGEYARQRTPGAVSASGPNRPDQIDPGDLARRIGALSPESTTLQDASRELVRMSGAGVDWSADGERDALGRIVSALQQEAALPAAAPAAPSGLSSGALRGAFADALRKEGAPR